MAWIPIFQPRDVTNVQRGRSSKGTRTTSSSYTFRKPIRKVGEPSQITITETFSKPIRRFSFFGFVVLLLIVFSVVGVLQGRSDQRTFYSFLEMLGNVPEVQIGFTDLVSTNLNFPSWLNWAEKILEIGAGFLGLLGFFLEGLISATMYLWYFVRWIFVV